MVDDEVAESPLVSGRSLRVGTAPPRRAHIYEATPTTGRRETMVGIVLQETVGVATSIAYTVWGLAGVVGLLVGYLLGRSYGGSGNA